MEDAKPEVWPYLLGVFAPDMSTNERQLKLSCIRIEFGALMEACKVWRVLMQVWGTFKPLN